MNNEQQSEAISKGDSVQEQAIHWFTVMNDHMLSSKYQTQFEHWYTSSASHRAAYDELLKVWDKAGFTDNAIAFKVNEKNDVANLHHQKTKSYTLTGGFAIAASLVMVFLLQINGTVEKPIDDSRSNTYTTAIAQTSKYTLADGSVLTLGPSSKVVYREMTDVRAATLISGRAYFDVQSKPDLPFIVIHGNNKVEVTGTEFEVNQLHNATQVSVVEGSVRVSSADETGYSVDIIQGEQVVASVSGNDVSAISPFSTEDALAWMDNKLVFSNTPLDEFVYRIQPYIDKTIVVKDEQIAQLTINTLITTDKVAMLIDSLPAAYPLHIEKQENAIIISYSN
ncbi:FecR family protein [Thalassotalea marina]|uniref:Sensor n=1 Tax=Thalassotalea marina TaxID=1673741 RepID=A0A919BGN6_9GAMM|nr:FecR domain-containing protein [Thalassotalea marina]GHF90033.1 sensor [Thalassotalea marina]